MLNCSVLKTIIINRILIIQTAFVGDVVLATGLAYKLKQFYPASTVSFLVRNGNEGLIKDLSSVDEVLVWNKKQSKTRNLVQLISRVRKNKFDCVINVQRHFSTGLITLLSGASTRIGFTQNPLSMFYTFRVNHDFPSSSGIHEIERNNHLIASFTDENPQKPVLEFGESVHLEIAAYSEKPYIVVAPASVWFTKQLPVDQWIKIMNKLSHKHSIYLLGAPSDVTLCEEIQEKSSHPGIRLLAGKISLEATVLLTQNASFALVNDSAPLHMASSGNTPVAAFFCSTLPEFGFYPLSDKSVIGEVSEPLSCRPCGLHGKKQCPKGHFKCGSNIQLDKVIEQTDHILPGIFEK